MSGNPWYTAQIGLADLKRRYELASEARLQRLCRAGGFAGSTRLRAWLGERLIRAGEALRPDEMAGTPLRGGVSAIASDPAGLRSSHV